MSDDIGMTTRRAYFGDEPVDRALSGENWFNADFREINNEFAWGAIWSRDGADLKLRSAFTLGALIALGRSEQIPIYLAAALRNGITARELKELLHLAIIYCGMPVAANAFRAAEAVLIANGVDLAGEEPSE